MWAIYAFLSAFFVAATDPIAKTLLKRSDEYLVGWLVLLLSTPFLAIPFFSHRIEVFSPNLVKTLLFVIPIEILASIFYYRALKLTEISLAVPFLALTPIFTIFVAFMLLGETIKPFGVLGILLISIGVYSLNLKEARLGPVYPIKAVFLNRGSLYMAIVAILFSVTSTVSKRAMLYTSPETIPFIYNLSISLGMVPILLYRLRMGYSTLNMNKKIAFSYLALGLFAAFSSICYFKSVSLANVAYTISIKRFSLLMSVGYGWLFFRERDVHIRFASTFCMLVGILLILLT